MLKTTTSIINGSQITGPINGVSIGATTASTGVFTSVNTTTGNFVPNTAGKGINFTANTPASGMTSQLLNWYEEGTWTVGLARSGGGLVYTPGVSDKGFYTKIGNLVTVNMIISGTFSGGSGGYQVTGLPFTVAATPYNTSTGLFANLSTGGAPLLTFIASSSTTTADIFGTPISGNIIVCSATYRT